MASVPRFEGTVVTEKMAQAGANAYVFEFDADDPEWMVIKIYEAMERARIDERMQHRDRRRS